MTKTDEFLSNPIHCEVIELNNDSAARRDDEQQRAALARQVAGADEISIGQAAILLGQPVNHGGHYGIIGAALVDAAKEGALSLTAPLTRVRCGGESDYAVRKNLASAPVSRAALRDWIVTYGTDAMRRSPAATWCGVGNDEMANDAEVTR